MDHDPLGGPSGDEGRPFLSPSERVEELKKKVEEIRKWTERAREQGGTFVLGLCAFHGVGWLYFILLVWTVEWCRPAEHCSLQSFGVNLQLWWATGGMIGTTFLFYKYHELRVLSEGGSSAEAGPSPDAESDEEELEDEYGICIDGEPQLDMPVKAYIGFQVVSIVWMIIAVHAGVELNPGYIRARKFFSLLPLLLIPAYAQAYLLHIAEWEWLNDSNSHVVRALVFLGCRRHSGDVTAAGRRVSASRGAESTAGEATAGGAAAVDGVLPVAEATVVAGEATAGGAAAEGTAVAGDASGGAPGAAEVPPGGVEAPPPAATAAPGADPPPEAASAPT
eukprot:TRINITY_DN91571_c0_g1_i1.p1 TRINITY_DN91571_c0_g1~~TRINITY_DN91571_c0_g1_i1.p1  ORF type:complete len:336 (-),score=59.58 TRINITY_DN91571_c0_g1_i1:31-1038(-)